MQEEQVDKVVVQAVRSAHSESHEDNVMGSGRLAYIAIGVYLVEV